jgi:hypothetical protein
VVRRNITLLPSAFSDAPAIGEAQKLRVRSRHAHARGGTKAKLAYFATSATKNSCTTRYCFLKMLRVLLNSSGCAIFRRE